MMPPMITGTFLIFTSWVAASTATLPWLCAVARVGGELAAVAEAAGVVDVAERHLDRFRAGLAVFAGRAGQLHHDADGDVAIGGERRQRRAASTASAVAASRQSLHVRIPLLVMPATNCGRRLVSMTSSPRLTGWFRPLPALRLYFMIAPCRPSRSRSSSKTSSPSGPLRSREHRGDLRVVGVASSASLSIATLAARWRGCARRRSPPRRPAGRARRGSRPVAMSTPWRSAIAAQRAQQRLEQVPAAEIVDDQLVFGERAVLERRRSAPARRASDRRGSRRRPCRSRAARHRARRGESTMARAPAGCRAANIAPACEAIGMPASTIAAMCGVSKLVPPTLSILPAALQLVEPARGLEPARHGVVPPVELHEIEPLDAAAAAASGR